MASVLGRKAYHKAFMFRRHWPRNDVGRCMSKVGFIGLGNMGANMARNLLQKGRRLVVYDVNMEAMASLVEEGATACKSPADVAAESDCIITMLANGSQVMDVYRGENGILESVRCGTLLIDSSTVDPSIPHGLAVIAEKEGAVFLDAPVSGGVNAAKAGHLTFMVGGRKEEFPAALELLHSMGSRAIYCGPVGSGQTAKICNNMLLAISMVGTAEAMNLGIRLGLQPKLLMEVINSSTGRCWSSEVYNPAPGTLENVPSNHNYEGGFGTKLMVKDLGLAQDAATKSQTPVPLGSLAHQIYRTMVARGFADKDFSSVYQFLKEDSEEATKRNCHS
ncbi:3-hydroxyisobutyrate dehydrogenase, mitochondrial [Anabrus simplex]|uniref:3-hydroxyisobutyrate dehydrogenase, mitochondrial n=1 Tax=Anabrus simplex TaxID=316456 RepID=UPI0035A393CD